MDTRVASVVRSVTAGSFALASGLHVAWGRGSTFPFATGAELTDNVVGSSRAPSPAWCYAVAAGLGGVALVTVSSNGGQLRRVVVSATAAAVGLRAALGFLGRTDLLVPGSTSPAFRRNDRRLLSPICAALTVGLVASTR